MDRARMHLRSTWWPGALWSVVVVAILTSAAVAQAPVTVPAPGEPWTVVAIGDSFFVGVGVARRSDAMPNVYGRLLAEAVGAPVKVINHGTGQLRTVADWAIEVSASTPLTTDLADADVVLVWLGYHDVLGHLWSTPWPDPLRAELEAVVERAPASWDAFFAALTAAAAPHARILVSEQGIPPYLFDRFGSHPDWAEVCRLAYLDWRLVMVETAERYGARLVPTFAALNGPHGDELVGPGSSLPDGLHFDEVLHRFVAELFREHDGIGRDN